MENNERKRIKIGALWESNQPNAFMKCFSGKFGDAWIEVRPNKFKSQNPKAPDYIIYICEQAKKEKNEQPITNENDSFFF